MRCSRSTRGRPGRRASSSTTSCGSAAAATPSPAALPAARLGRARSGGDLGERPRRRRAGAARHEAAGAAGDRDHEPARDDAPVGAKQRTAGPATRSSGRTGAPPSAAASCRRPRLRELTGLVADPVLLGDEARVAAPARRERRAARVRHRRLLARLEADRRPRPRHRRDERIPHAARLARHARLGRRAARPLRRPARPAAGDPAFERGRGRGRALRRDRAGRGDRRRPAGRSVRRGRDRQGHLRNRSFVLAPTGRTARRRPPDSCARPPRAAPPSRRATRSRARSSSRAQRCNGSATGSA